MMLMQELPPILAFPFSDHRPPCREDCGEPLVSLSVLCPERIVCAPAYYARRLPGALEDCLLREGAARRLLEAARALPAGWKLQIFDGWRPARVQKALFDEYFCRLAAREENQDRTVREVIGLTREFVSFPGGDAARPFVHGSGGAVDLTILDGEGQALPMGTGFDDFTPLSHLRSFEGQEGIVRDNRRLLYSLMTGAGFTGYPFEWWHYDYGDGFWAAVTGCEPVYGGIFTEDEQV